MCGRTACALAPDVICRACSYRDPKTSTYKTPTWKEHPGSGPTQYYPDANVTPTKYTPVLFKDSESGEYVIQPMQWGMIPPWHKGAPKSHGFSTNNCRIEGIKETKLYRRSLNARNVCIVLAQGFYEWKAVEGKNKEPKQPYLIYMVQDETFKLKIADESIWNEGVLDENEGWTGPRILMMAGLYDVWTSPEGEKIYSYTVITMGSNKTLSWLHERMPAILESPKEVEDWLNVTKETDVNDLIKILKPATQLQWYPVSTKVNSSKCHDMDCSKPIEIKENKAPTMMSNWLKKGAGAGSSGGAAKKEVPEKKPKLDKEEKDEGEEEQD